MHKTEQEGRPCITQQQVSIATNALAVAMYLQFPLKLQLRLYLYNSCMITIARAISVLTRLSETLALHAGNHAAAILTLISHHANVNSKNDAGDSALHTAAAQGSVAAIHALLSQV